MSSPRLHGSVRPFISSRSIWAFVNVPACRKAYGEEWQVHGGGFYHIQKYLVAPAQMPEHLTWFKWESYATWLSGFTLLCIVYYAGADLYLIDPNVLDVSRPVAILISIASLAFGWIAYNTICKLMLGKSDTLLMVLLYVILVLVAWGYTHLFTGRAAFLHLGAFTATIMSANVFMIIIPNQKIVVADLIAGRKPDPKYGKIAKQRSTHNNYLTLPVLFLMLSNHYPLAFGTEFNWIIASLVFLMGVTIRHWFNTQHARKGKPTWTWLVTVILFIVIIWLSTVPKVLTGEPEEQKVSALQQSFISDPHFEKCGIPFWGAAPCVTRRSRAGKASSRRPRAWCSTRTGISRPMLAKSICRRVAPMPCRPPMLPA